MKDELKTTNQQALEMFMKQAKSKVSQYSTHKHTYSWLTKFIVIQSSKEHNVSVDWKKAYVVPIYKGGRRKNTLNYRPVSNKYDSNNTGKDSEGQME